MGKAMEADMCKGPGKVADTGTRRGGCLTTSSHAFNDPKKLEECHRQTKLRVRGHV